MLESGWEELGMDDQWAARVATDMVDNDDPAGGLDFYKVRWVPWVRTVGVVVGRSLQWRTNAVCVVVGSLVRCSSKVGVLRILLSRLLGRLGGLRALEIRVISRVLVMARGKQYRTRCRRCHNLWANF